MSRPIVFGIAVLLIANLAWFVGLQFESFSRPIYVLVWAAPVVASALVSSLAVRHRIVLGLAMTVPAVVLPLVFNAGYQLLGNRVDFPGVAGALNLALMIGPFTLLLCAAGSTAGYVLSRKSR